MHYGKMITAAIHKSTQEIETNAPRHQMENEKKRNEKYLTFKILCKNNLVLRAS